MKTEQSETVMNGELSTMTRFIPMLLQVLLILTVLPYLSHDDEADRMGITRDRVLLGVLTLLFVISTIARQQNVITGLAIANTAMVSVVFGSLAHGEAFLPYPYFVILMIALLGQNVRHTASSVAILCAGYLSVLYQHHAFSQHSLLLVPVLVIMSALVTCHVFRAELLVTQATQYRDNGARDPLTGLANRAGFIDRIWASIHAAGRVDGMFAVLFIDLDGFKAVNDRFGHRAGDELLCDIAGRLRSSLRKGDVPARYGGDEFCVLVTRVDSKKEALGIAERILDNVKAPVIIGRGQTATVGASIGIALSSNVHTKPEDLIRDADAAMYRVKQRGKNGIAVSDQLAASSSSATQTIPLMQH